MSLDNPLHLAFLLLLVLLVFGAKRLPEMGRSLGSGMRGFRDAISGDAAAASGAGELNPGSPGPAALETQTAEEEPAAVRAEPTAEPAARV